MKRSPVGLLLLTLLALLATPASVFANSIAGAMGNLRWGMNEREVRQALESRIKDKSAVHGLQGSYVEFNGKSTSWDHSPIAEDYTHGNEEAMLSYKDKDGSDNYYFFIGGQLWKWVKLYPASAFGGRDYSGFVKKVESRFGKGHEKEGEVNPGSGATYKYVEMLDRNTRLRAVDKTDRLSAYALMFEAMDTVRSLSSLRSNTIRRATFKSSSRTTLAQSEPAPARAEAPASTLHAAATRAGGDNKGKHKSIMQGEGGDEPQTQADYNARKARAQAEANDKQRRIYDRGQESKKGKILDDLAGMDDSDPISGAK
jgi:hypothetical protein